MLKLPPVLLFPARLALLCLLLGAFAPAGAQPPGSVPADTAEPAAETVDSADDGSGRPPDDYEASEQISEDLSVSFPVDI